MASLSPVVASDIQWVFCALTIAFTLGRVSVRIFTGRKLQSDDLAHTISLALLISACAIWTASITLQTSANPEDAVPSIKFEVAFDIIMIVLLWSVKATFLLLYQRLFKKSSALRKAWWAIAIFTFLSFWVVLAGRLTRCGGNTSSLLDSATCSNEHSASLNRAHSIYYYIFDISSDLAIILLPLPYLNSLFLSTAPTNYPFTLMLTTPYLLSLLAIATLSLRTASSAFLLSSPTSRSPLPSLLLVLTATASLLTSALLPLISLLLLPTGTDAARPRPGSPSPTPSLASCATMVEDEGKDVHEHEHGTPQGRKRAGAWARTVTKSLRSLRSRAGGREAWDAAEQAGAGTGEARWVVDAEMGVVRDLGLSSWEVQAWMFVY